jgi:hypothetical protein
MLGAFAVGKTSLVQRFVNSIFSEKYHTTIGVKIDQKLVAINDTKLNLLLWDIHGEDDFQKVKASYIMGASGYFIVMDGTRGETYQVGIELMELAKSAAPTAGCIILINKSDLKSAWEITSSQHDELISKGYTVIETSAKDNIAVEDAFVELSKMMLN